jgi:hypothetical protein
MTGCCDSTVKSETWASLPEVAVDVNEPAPFPGVLMPRERYNWFVICEGYILMEGIQP